jgi:hypothetical protein
MFLFPASPSLPGFIPLQQPSNKFFWKRHPVFHIKSGMQQFVSFKKQEKVETFSVNVYDCLPKIFMPG